MKIQKRCETCILRRQKEKANQISDPETRRNYLDEVQRIMKERKAEDSSPYILYLYQQTFRKFIGASDSFREEKQRYNSFVMEMEDQIEKKIEEAKDPLEKAIIYSQIGNYIDFGGALKTVDTGEFLMLLEKQGCAGLDAAVYSEFCRQCESAERFLLLCDNCGEIVLDKLLMRQLKKRFPHLKLTAMVRGAEVVNDATMEDALFCGMDRVAALLSNGNGAAGTLEKLLSKEAKDELDAADVILAKGQANYESLSEEGRSVFYSFLCKCDLFTERFQVPKLTGMFVYESGRS